MNKYCGEVIQSSLDNWIVQAWQYDEFPSFGSIVTVNSNNSTSTVVYGGHSKKIYGIVYQIQTGSDDPVRYPFAYQKTEEELKAEQPQIFEFLRTNFSCLTIGYENKNKIIYTLPPEPPKIHAFVSPINPTETQEFFKNTQYLQLLFAQASKIPNIDELLFALINNFNKTNISEEYFNEFIETYSLLTDNDYRRLKLLLKRLNENLL